MTLYDNTPTQGKSTLPNTSRDATLIYGSLKKYGVNSDEKEK